MEAVLFYDIKLVVSPGSPEEKSSLMFSMNDLGGTGSLSKGEFARMLRFGPLSLSQLSPLSHHSGSFYPFP